MLDTIGRFGLNNGSINSVFSNLGFTQPDPGTKGTVPEKKEVPAQTAPAHPALTSPKVTVPAEKTDTDKEKEDGDDGNKTNAGNFFSGFGIPGVSFLNMSDLQGMLGTRPKVKKNRDKDKGPVIDIRDIPRPDKIKSMLDEYVVGQEHAKKVISVAVYNHYKRVASEGLPGNRFSEGLKDVEIEKSNMLMIGPTGCGKTYLVKTLARLLDVPLAIADATSLTEAGYIGDDIESVVTKLLTAADNDVDKAETGIIFIDEIDKIAKKKNTNNRDVSGESVQQGMLKLLEGSEIEVPVGSNSKNAMVPLATVNTRNILFICGGAFPDLDEIIKQRLRKQTSIGFNAELKDSLDKRKDILKEVSVEDVKKFGMIPEFVGRLPMMFSLEGLSEEMLVKILKEPKNAIIKQYQKLFEMDEVSLEFTDEALLEIAKKALLKDTGARALRSVIEEFMLDLMYEIPKDDNIGRVIVTREYVLKEGGPVIELRSMSRQQPLYIGKLGNC
ncbi:MAG TPA: ATP-dependent Clp protease ATP-binding subunit ClpX [Lachnospiraceae bacterium]|nr:ATP-dependent Clp protease ATP-binding subunit ClpX [Lachnospiraceae bacterium]